MLPYHLDALKQLAGRLALTSTPRWKPGSPPWSRSGAGSPRGLPSSRSTWPSAANFVLFRPDGRDGADVWQALVDRSVLVRDCSSWPRLDGCLRVTIGTPAEDDAFLAALAEVLA